MTHVVFAVIVGWVAFLITFVLYRSSQLSLVDTLPIPMVVGPVAGLASWSAWSFVTSRSWRNRSLNLMRRRSAFQQTYGFGWLYVYLIFAWTSTMSKNASDMTAYLFLAANVLAGLAAAVRRPWDWYVVLVASIVHAARNLYLGTSHILDLEAGNSGALLWMSVVTAAGSLLGLLYFSYFYRRRAMFGASWRWRSLERLVPALVGPEHYQKASATVSRVGVFGMSYRMTVFVALALLMVLLVIYQTYFLPVPQP